MTQQWMAIVREGEPIRQVAGVEGEDLEGATVVLLERPGDPAFEELDLETGKWTVKLEQLRLTLRDRVQRAADARKGVYGAALDPQKIIEHAMKRAEIAAFDAPGHNAFEVDFPFAAADAAEHGDTVEAAIDRFRVGAAGLAAFAAVCAREQGAKRAIEAAFLSGDMEAMIAAADVAWE